MSIVTLHENAKADLLKLRKTDLGAFSVIYTLLETLHADPNAIDLLTTHGNVDVGEHLLNIKRWIKADPRNIWRFRVLNSPATVYRVVYGYHWPTRTLHVLAVVRKEEFDYDDPCSSIAQRIFRDWEESIF